MQFPFEYKRPNINSNFLSFLHLCQSKTNEIKLKFGYQSELHDKIFPQNKFKIDPLFSLLCPPSSVVSMFSPHHQSHYLSHHPHHHNHHNHNFGCHHYYKCLCHCCHYYCHHHPLSHPCHHHYHLSCHHYNPH